MKDEAGFEVVYSYSRKEAIADGVLVDLWQGELEAICRRFFKVHVAVTESVWGIIQKAVEAPNSGNDLNGVVHDILWMCFVKARNAPGAQIMFRVIIAGAGPKEECEFKSILGPGDMGEPVMTIMLPGED